jgi:urea transport system ATP-binding protein
MVSRDRRRSKHGDSCPRGSGPHSLVVVEHDMAFIEKIARKVTVLHEGSVLAEGPMAEVQADPRVVEVYLGR